MLILTQKRKHTQLMVMTKILHGKDKLTKLTFSYFFWIHIFQAGFLLQDQTRDNV